MDIEQQLLQIFHPQMIERIATAQSKDTRFVHYTSTDAAMSILSSKEVWMRKASCMNDFTEVQYGLHHLRSVYNGTKAGPKFRAALEGIFPGFCKGLEDAFNPWQPVFPEHTYLACLSRYDDKEKKADNLGRLSMWRAYGKTTGVALILTKRAAGTDDADAINGIYTVPVDYMDGEGFEAWLDKMADNISNNASLLQQQGQQTIHNWVFRMLMFAAISSKHPGFREEEEWRVVYSPKIESSPDLKKGIHHVNGETQPVYKIPLRNIPALIDSVIIGPTQYPEATKEAFVDLLTEAGVTDAEEKVFVSYIPLRR